MKKSFLFTTLLLMLASVQAQTRRDRTALPNYTNTQLPQWYFYNASGNNTVNFTGSSPTTSNNGLRPVDPTTLSPLTDDDVIATNSYIDKNGNLLFYVVNTKCNTYGGTSPNFCTVIYDANNNVIGNDITYNVSNNTFGREISIIPINILCSIPTFHIITAGRVLKLEYNKTTLQYGNIVLANKASISYLYGANGPWGDGILVGNGQTNLREYPIAVSKPINGKYHIYSINQNSGGNPYKVLRRITVDATDDTYSINDDINFNSYYPAFVIPNTQYATEFGGSGSEMELNSNGSQLAFSDQQYIMVFNVNTNGSVNISNSNYAPYRWYNFNGGSTGTDYNIAGLEFNASNQIVFSRYDRNPNNTLSQAVGIWDYTTTTPNVSYISGSGAYGRSMIEKGMNGKLYISNGTSLDWINVGTTSSISTGVNMNNLRNKNTTDIFIYGTNISYPQDHSIYTLPDQIDGWNYPTVYDDKVFSYIKNLTGTADYDGTATTGSSPWGVGNKDIYVFNKITIKSGATIVLRNFLFEFSPNTEIVVENGAILVLINTALQGACGTMWKGVSVYGGGRFEMYATDKDNVTQQYLSHYPPNNPQIDRNSQILDAYIGIRVLGYNSNLFVGDYSWFQANENHINVNNSYGSVYTSNYTPYTSFNPLRGVYIVNSQFDNTENLHEIGRGIEGKGITSITIDNSGYVSNTNYTEILNCSFDNGQNGIYFKESNGIVRGCWFYNQYKKSIWAQNTSLKNIGAMILGINRRVDVFNNTFNRVNQALGMYDGYSSTMQSNSIDRTDTRAIEYKRNYNCALLIGSETNANLKNTFTDCAWEAIGCFDNRAYNKPIVENAKITGTEITIAQNLINQTFAGAGSIVISEGSKPVGGPSFKTLLIRNNTITKMQMGIRIDNVVGVPLVTRYNDKTGSSNKLNYSSTYPIDRNTSIANITNYPQCDIYRNSISTQKLWNDTNYAIRSMNSDGIHIVENTTSDPTNNINSLNAGVRLLGGQSVLVYKNTMTNGVGLYANGLMNLSDYTCNTFDNCRWGMRLEDHLLRDYKIPHGIKGQEGRTNYFSNVQPRGGDLLVAQYNLKGTLFDYRQRNLWIFDNIQQSNGKYIHDPNTRVVTLTKSLVQWVDNDPRNPAFNVNQIYHSRQINPCEIASVNVGTDTVSGAENIAYVQWINIYNQQRINISTQASAIDGTPITVSNPFIVGFVNMEDRMSKQEFDVAKEILMGLEPQNTFESNLVTVYSLMLATYYPTLNTYSYDDLQTLKNIASTNVYDAGMAKYIASAILYQETQDNSEDEFIDLEVMQGKAYLNSCAEGAIIDSISIRDLDMDSIMPIVGYDRETFAFNVEIVSWAGLNPDHQYDFIAYSNGVAKPYGSPRQKREWIDLSGNIDLFFVCDGGGKTTLADMIKAIKLYPNPAKDELNIEGLSMAGCQVEIYDIQGNLAKSEALQTGIQKINLVNMSKGLYLVKVKDPKGNNLKTIKIVIE